MTKLPFIAIPLIVMLTGCISLAPQNSDVAIAPVPEYLSQSSDKTAVNISNLGWRHYFNDPQLVNLIDMALANNSDLRLAALKTLESYKQYGVAQSDRYPLVTGQSSVDYAGQNHTETSKKYSIGATVSFEFDLFGRLKNLSESQLEAYFATEEAQRNVYMLLVSQVAQAYFNEQIVLQKLATADRQMANYQQALTFTQAGLASGESSYLDYQQAKGMLESIKVSRVELQQEQQLAHHTLQNLVNRYDFTVKPVDALQVITLTIPPNLPSSALLTRPDIMQAEHQLKASNADIGVARAAFFPSISLTGSLSNSSTELSDLLSGATLWDFVPKISLPIFNAGQNQLNLEIANIRQQQAGVEYEKTLHAAFKEVADLLVLAQSYGQQLTLQQQYLATQQTALTLSQEGYLSGSASYLDILDAQRNVFSTELTLLTLKQNTLANQVSLFVALGGGWQE
ncbi:Cu(I)/Ag(I) efflux system outer membrane protein [Orbus hercynius]|uniref:Cu(I)/Ag(I) efflux system outer membrane protein n=1 Tax=Orbus hercynius TaxID=593135 RepID=A0A495RDC0_9GAMM|nr:efflux transporter outer membrane subunit [Orbus hercynius]RKS85270.1 Cu(I)/Ag(I) efflux system outer membrane protein [Orbus hercynius]